MENSGNAVQSEYDSKLWDFYKSHSKRVKNTKKPWSAKRISQVIQRIKDCRVRKSMDYYWMSKYDLMETADEVFLIYRKKTVEDPTIQIVPMEKYYEILTEVHKSVKHGGRLKMINYIKNKMYIPRKAIQIFIEMCSVCELKRSGSINKQTEPIISEEDFNVRGQVDLVDLRSAPDGEFKWLLNYQDHVTKFVHLRPLKTRRVGEIALTLLKIFLEFGAPCILQSNNGRKFTALVVEVLVMLWPDCKIIHGSPQCPQNQGSIERSNQDVEYMLRGWMQDNKSTNWSVGCYSVQFYKNSLYHHIIGRSPYQAMFGTDPKSLMSSIHMEDKLDKIIKNVSEKNYTKYTMLIDNIGQQKCTSGTNKDVTIKIAEGKNQVLVKMTNNKETGADNILSAEASEDVPLNNHLPNDMDNYIKCRVMGSVSQVRMKPGCVPTRFECQADREAQTASSTEQPHVAKKRRKILIGESLTPLAEKSTRIKRIKTAVTSTETSESQHNLDINTPMKPLITYKKPVQCQTCKSNIDNSHNDTSKRKRTTDDNLPEAEEIIESVYKYLQAEYELLKRYIGELSSLSDVLKRTADACGVRESTVRHVVRKPRPQRDLDVAGVGSEPAGGQPICGDSDIERQDDSSIAEEEFNSTYYAVEPEDNDEQSDEDSEEPDECEVEAPNMDIDHDENNHLDPLKTEPVEIKTEFTDMNPYSITNEKSRCDIPDIEQDVIEVTGDEIEERVQCDEQVVVKPEFTDVLYSHSVLCTSDVICDTTSYDVKCDPPGP